MKQRITAGAAVLFSVLSIAGCTVHPPPAPIVPPPAPHNPQDPFRPYESKCQSDLTGFAGRLDDLVICIDAIDQEIDRRGGHLLPGWDGKATQMPEYQHSPCQSDLTPPALDNDGLARCHRVALEWLQNAIVTMQ